ncbi:BnaA03g48790D [Brassica napus]|uniref:BnaA03g48790D protein n=1 Tax=Brassica napus TaxID=3708 RepID=A0A078GZ40_BRANA|nr:BnaA03g48790D [Brassica napus]
MAQSIGPRLYSCCNCRNHVGLHDDIISKAFQGRTGRAFLFSHAMNIVLGAKEDRNLLTGLTPWLTYLVLTATNRWVGTKIVKEEDW